MVFPCVPATATVRRVAQMPARIWARLSTGMPRRLASATSGLPAGTAVETVTNSTSPTFSARWPTLTTAPRARRRSRGGEDLRSLPLTW